MDIIVTCRCKTSRETLRLPLWKCDPNIMKKKITFTILTLALVVFLSGCRKSVLTPRLSKEYKREEYEVHKGSTQVKHEIVYLNEEKVLEIKRTRTVKNNWSVPTTAIGTIGHLFSIAKRADPVLATPRPRPFERVPSGNILSN